MITYDYLRLPTTIIIYGSNTPPPSKLPWDPKVATLGGREKVATLRRVNQKFVKLAILRVAILRGGVRLWLFRIRISVIQCGWTLSPAVNSLWEDLSSRCATGSWVWNPQNPFHNFIPENYEQPIQYYRGNEIVLSENKIFCWTDLAIQLACCTSINWELFSRLSTQN